MRFGIFVTFIIALAFLAACASAETTVDFDYTQGTDASWLVVGFNGTVSALEENVTVSSWEWDFRDGYTSTAETPSHTFTYETEDDLTQTVGVTVTLSDDSTVFREKNIVLVYPTLDAEFTITPESKEGYAPLVITVVDTTVGPHDVYWDFGDGNTSSLSEISNKYWTVDTYTVTLTVTRGTDSNEMEKIVTVKSPAVTAAFSANVTEGIVPLPVKFTSTSDDVSTWSWEIEGLTTASTESFDYTFNTVGNYSVLLSVVGEGGGTDTEQKLDYIVVKPNITAGFTATPRYGDNPLTVQFTDTSTGYQLYESRFWDFGDGRTENRTDINPQHTFWGIGSFNVSLTVENDQGTVTIVKDNYIVTEAGSTPTPTATTATPTPTATTAAPTATAAPTEEIVTAAANSVTVPGTKIFGIPGTEFFRTEIGRLYSFYKEYLYLMSHFS